MRIYNPVTDGTRDLCLNKELNKPEDGFKTMHQAKSHSKGFNRKLGLFSDFVENNNCLNVYGPLCGNKRGVSRDPHIYAYSNIHGASIPRNTKLQMDVNPDILDTFRRTAQSTFNNRKTMSSFMQTYKKQQR